MFVGVYVYVRGGVHVYVFIGLIMFIWVYVYPELWHRRNKDSRNISIYSAKFSIFFQDV